MTGRDNTHLGAGPGGGRVQPDWRDYCPHQACRHDGCERSHAAGRPVRARMQLQSVLALMVWVQQEHGVHGHAGAAWAGRGRGDGHG